MEYVPAAVLCIITLAFDAGHRRLMVDLSKNLSGTARELKIQNSVTLCSLLHHDAGEFLHHHSLQGGYTCVRSKFGR